MLQKVREIARQEGMAGLTRRSIVSAYRRGVLPWASGDYYREAQLWLGRRRLLASRELTAEDRELLKRIRLRMSHREGMWGIGTEKYLNAGLSAMRLVRSAIGDRVPGRILDLPSGHGRVLRFLRAAYPGAEIVAAELDPDAVGFCARTFGAEPAVVAGPASTDLPGTFDLIWCGSLITHFHEGNTAALLRLFRRHLAPGGLCMFTTHGARAEQWLRDGTAIPPRFDLSPEGLESLLAQYGERGYGFARYPADLPPWGGSDDYGISLTSRERIVEIAGEAGDWTLSFFAEAGWMGYHDVYGFTAPQRS